MENSIKSKEVPVLIVGGGAAGTALALELARQGVEARLVDRLSGPSPYTRAITVHARTLELLENIDPVLARRFLERGVHSPGYVMHYVNERQERSEVRPGLDFTNLSSPYPFLLLHGQNETEGTLRDYMRETWGMQPEWGVSCTEIRPGDAHVDALLQHADGKVEQVRCQYLVACDGANSSIRRQLGLTQEGSDYAGMVLQNLDIEVENFPDWEDWVHYCMGPAHFMMVVKLPGGFFRLLMSQPADHADLTETPQHVFSSILSQHFDGIRFGKAVWHSRWGSTVRLSHNYRHGHVFLAGDAAHVHSTAGGQGMNCCVQDAWNLGWKLAMVLKGQARPALLDTYETERKPIGKQVIEAASSIHELFMTGRNDGPEALERLKQSGFLTDLINRVSGIAYHYRAVDENQGQDTGGFLCSGDRMPNLPLGNMPDKQWLYDLTRHSGMTLLVAMRGDGFDGDLQSVVQGITKCYPDALRSVELPHAPAALLPENADARLYLVRPDAYLAQSCDPANPDELKRWIKTYLA